MIISHRYQFIFIKTVKTAGTSLEIALSQFCGSDDIISPIEEEENEKIGATFRPDGTQASYRERPLRSYTFAELRKRLTRGKKRYFKEHTDAARIQKAVDRNVWNGYLKFCVARNPFDRAVSLYHWRRSRGKGYSNLSEFVQSDAIHDLHRLGYDLYTIGGKVQADLICRYESLAQDLASVRQRLGLPQQLELPRANSGIRPSGSDYRQLLDAADRRRIETVTRPEIDLLGYQW